MTEFVAPDGSVRQQHYGVGEQPWDVILREGWGPAFAAGNVLKYLRRDKAPEHSLSSARWYWRQIVERSGSEKLMDEPWSAVLERLLDLMTSDEYGQLSG